MFRSEVTSLTWCCDTNCSVDELALFGFSAADLFLLSSLCSGLLSNTLSLLLFKVTLVLLDAGLNRQWLRGEGARLWWSQHQ